MRNLYRERLKYLLNDVWPIEQELREVGSSENLAQLAMCCGTEFPDAVATVLPLLSKLTRPEGVLWFLKEKDLAEKYPGDTLKLIDGVLDDEPAWGWEELRELLGRISATVPELRDDPRFLRLNALLRRFE